MAALLPKKGNYIDITGFLPPAGLSADAVPANADDIALVAEVKRLRKPPTPLQVVEEAEGWRLADKASWRTWTALRGLDSGIGLVPDTSVEVVVEGKDDGGAHDCAHGDTDDAIPVEIQRAVNAGTPPPTKTALVEMATAVGVDVTDLFSGRGRPSTEGQQQAWERIVAAAQKAPDAGDMVEADVAEDTTPNEKTDNPDGAPAAGSPPSRSAVQLIRIDKIVVDAGTQVRDVRQDKVADYVERMEAGDVFPPLVVVTDGKTSWLSEGYHRIEAYQKRRFTHVECIVRKGSLRDAILNAAASNARHGIQRSNKDKRQAVHAVLTDEEWRVWTDGRIATHVGVSDRLVGDVRAEMEASGVVMPTERIDARGRRIQTAKIGTRGSGTLAEQGDGVPTPKVSESAEENAPPMEEAVGSNSGGAGPAEDEGEPLAGASGVAETVEPPTLPETPERTPEPTKAPPPPADEPDPLTDVAPKQQAAGHPGTTPAKTDEEPRSTRIQQQEVLDQLKEWAAIPAKARKLVAFVAEEAGLDCWIDPGEEEANVEDAADTLAGLLAGRVAVMADDDWERAAVWVEAHCRDLSELVQMRAPDNDDEV